MSWAAQHRLRRLSTRAFLAAAGLDGNRCSQLSPETYAFGSPPGRVYAREPRMRSKGSSAAALTASISSCSPSHRHNTVSSAGMRIDPRNPRRAAAPLPLLDRRLNSLDGGNQLLLGDAWPVALDQVGGWPAVVRHEAIVGSRRPDQNRVFAYVGGRVDPSSLARAPSSARDLIPSLP